MTVKDFLEDKCKDEYFSPNDVKVKIALGMFAEQFASEKNGFSLEDLEDILRKHGINEEDCKTCERYVSDIGFYLSNDYLYKDKLDEYKDKF
jgi:hypothetical protein